MLYSIIVAWQCHEFLFLYQAQEAVLHSSVLYYNLHSTGSNTIPKHNTAATSCGVFDLCCSRDTSIVVLPLRLADSTAKSISQLRR